jgi:hypothetical protein
VQAVAGLSFVLALVLYVAWRVAFLEGWDWLMARPSNKEKIIPPKWMTLEDHWRKSSKIVEGPQTDRQTD